MVVDKIRVQLAFVRTLRGLTTTFGSFSDGGFDELEFERHLSADPILALPECSYWIRKLQARFFAGDYVSAIQASLKAELLLWTSRFFFEAAEYHFYSALARAAAFDSATENLREEHVKALGGHHTQLVIWAENCPENFENRAALVGAEIARIEDRDLDAMRLYEQAICSALANGFVHNEGVANELAGRFYLGRGMETAGYAYLRNARTCYERWGATGKVRQLDEHYSRLCEERTPVAAGAIGERLGQLDFETVVKASQALSSEIVLPKLIEKLVRMAVENAGAERGLLILVRGSDPRIEAEATAGAAGMAVAVRQTVVTPADLPQSLLQYVIRTQEGVLLDDASTDGMYSMDEYVRRKRSRSVLCLPIVKQMKLVGALYLENNLAPFVFTRDRVAVLQLLASQAAISLENAALYSDLQERESKVRRLIDSNFIGILIGNLDGHIHEANQAFLEIIGYDQADVEAGRLRRTELTPAEWQERDVQAVDEMRTVGTAQPYEKEYFRKDGSRVPVLVGGAAFGEPRHAVVAFIVDLTERKRAEAELMHANRVATMGQLTASIAHEVSQPVSGLLINAQIAIRSLAGQPPNLEEARSLIERIIRDGRRTADIVSRIRDFSKKLPARKAALEINEAIVEIMGLTRVPMSDNGVLAKMQLTEGLPHILGDRVQLQQVILNLVMNAIEAMSDLGGGPRELLISTSKAEADSVLVAVSDTGPVLTQADLGRVFEAFYTTKPGGLGMGLSICRSIVEAHGGRLWATPNELQGAVFCLTLPIVAKIV